MPDDEGRRRRLGDETKNRIADLASGWSLDGDDPPSPIPAHTPRPQPKSAATPVPKSAATPVPKSTATPVPAPPATERSKPRTAPPPPPGSAARKAMDERSGAVTSERAASASGTTTVAPAKSGPQFKRAGYTGPQAPFSTEGKTFSSEPHTPAVIVDDSLSGPIAVAAAASNVVGREPSAPVAPLPGGQSTPIRAAPSRPAAVPAPLPPKLDMPLPPSNHSSIPGLKVPVGEFDSGVQTIEQSTFGRESTDSVLRRLPTADTEDLLEDDDGSDASTHIAASEPARGDATMLDPQTAKFERGDPTSQGALDSVPDATMIEGPSGRLRHQSGGTLRPSAALRRKRGALGDARYVFTAVFGVRESRRELAELEHRQNLRQTSRRRHLITLGRTAVITDAFDHPSLGKAREQLQAIEDERSRHAGAVSASDAELDRVRRDRETKARQYVTDLATTDAELADLQKKLEPLEKEATLARKRAQELREALQRIEKKIADTERLLDSVKAEKLDKGALLADIATYKADRQAVLRDEPVIAAQLDALDPRIAAMVGTRNELRRKRSELEKAEADDQRRTLELLDAIGAKRKVVERAAGDAETARDAALFELGERLYVDRPKPLATLLSPIDQIDLELGEGDRRAMELKEILSNIDKAKFARGAALIVLALAAFAMLVAGAAYLIA